MCERSLGVSVFYPDLYLKSITGLTPALLKRWGIRGLILDVDNTLTTHDNPRPDPGVLLWLKAMREHHIEMAILSNNSPQRIKPFAKELRMGFIANAKKPLASGFERAAAKLRLQRDKIAVVGDQIFTDILGGNLWGAKTVLVKPIQPETTRLFRLKRRLERDVILRLYGAGKLPKEGHCG